MSTPIDLNLVGNLTLNELLRHVEEDKGQWANTVTLVKLFFRNLTLDELLRHVEEDELVGDDEININSMPPITANEDLTDVGDDEININSMPPITANEDLTDEDSGDEDIMSINNLAGSQLLAEAEIYNFYK
ncbi:Transposase IS4 [Popillia japonica]|uniref:Transposase IS4 n=1 Tax=Popillia japonica TaxID=7064 RepID=A0AAW1LDL9_POPJA